MKSRRLITVGLLTFMIGAIPISTHAGGSEDAQRGEARAELAAVTVDVDRANVTYSPSDNGVGSDFTQVVQYQQEYLEGRQSFDDGNYRGALQHLRKADQIIRSQPDWTEAE